MGHSKPIYNDRETARAKLTAKIEHFERAVSDPNYFATISASYLLEDARFRLRWLDCAPEGANHLLAPMQDKQGVPMGSCWNENLGPCQALRDARKARNLDPLTGKPL